MYPNEYSEKPLLEKLIMLRDGLVKNGEDNEYTALLTKWINNINDPKTLEEIDNTLYYKMDIHFDYYDTSPMFSYLNSYWSSAEQNNKNLDFFLPRKDTKLEMKKKYTAIINSAKKCLSLIGQSAEFERESKVLALNLKWIYDNMVRHPSADLQVAANFYRLSLHVDNADGLNDVVNFFEDSVNQKMFDYISGFSDNFIIQPSWSNLYSVTSSISKRRS